MMSAPEWEPSVGSFIRWLLLGEGSHRGIRSAANGFIVHLHLSYRQEQMLFNVKCVNEGFWLLKSWQHFVRDPCKLLQRVISGQTQDESGDASLHKFS